VINRRRGQPNSDNGLIFDTMHGFFV